MSDSPQDTFLVFGDSLAYYGPTGGLPADHPQIWPVTCAKELGLKSALFARVGWTTRDGWWSLVNDPSVWATIPHTKAVVIALAGMDSMPSPLPTPLREMIRYTRPPWLRRYVRNGYGVAQKYLSPLGWPMALPTTVTVEYLEKMVEAISAVKPDIPIVCILPPTHKAEPYSAAHPGRDKTAAAIRAWATPRGIPLVDHSCTDEHVLSGQGNPDGIHWDFPGHRIVHEHTMAVLHSALTSDTR